MQSIKPVKCKVGKFKQCNQSNTVRIVAITALAIVALAATYK